MKNKIKNQYRQGDILIQECKTIPKSAVKQKAVGKIILAHGEVTGHHHSLEADAADWWKEGDSQYLDVVIAKPVKHQEHGPIPLRAKKHIIIRQSEYTPAEIRNVQD
jgi:hypothetical protein